MKLIQRTVENLIRNSLVHNKVVVLIGPRRIGKTILIKQLIQTLEESFIIFNGEDFATHELLSRRSVQHYKKILGTTRILIIDEAQKIPDIGSKLKLMIDEIDNLKILVTGSSSFDLTKITGEPLTGRKKTIYMYPFSEKEYDQIETTITKKDNIKERLVYGCYPELIHIEDLVDKADYLKEIVNSYLLKDILVLENIRNSDKIFSLLKLIAFQIGNEVSIQKLSGQLGMSKNTVAKYLDLLTKVFILHKVSGFSRNLRKEVTKNNKWYFYDNGIRNLIIANLNPLELRNDVGALWENYVISERLKTQAYNRHIVNNYFWRTYDQQEIDWVEERNGNLFGYEFKWNPKRNVKAPQAWRKAYPEAEYKIIHVDNFLEWQE